ncbi:SLAP domain-containing protein [Companilactobacillus metriopterae]|uniref:SLAP domain-containing protein n=1 Tax=Companilactobacillus metriopterae TaxID=1909267 RepID=UPI00100BA6BE|nr:SLAP domain-containing protein [Companilactobacillus metriopterae]
MKRKITLILSITVIAILCLFTFSINTKADSLPYSVEHSAVQVTVPNPILVNNTGTSVVDKNITLDSDWATPYLGTISISNKNYYQIAKDEYILSDDVYHYVATSEIITVTSKVPAQLYTYDLKPIKNRMLAPNTSWYSDRTIGTNKLDGSGFYLRVATNEFVRFSDALF